MPDPLFSDAVAALGMKVAMSSDDDLLGFQMNLEAALAEEELLTDATVEHATGPSRITAQAELVRTANTLTQVPELLYRVWQRVCYHEFQATSLDMGPKFAELRFMTASTPHLGLAGSMRIGGPQYEKLYRKKR